MEYDELNRLTRTTQDPGGLALVSETVQFDENGNPLVVRDPKGQTITSTFDELNRLSSKSYAFAPDDPERPWRHTNKVEYSYDENGNVLRQDETVAGNVATPPPTAIVRTYDQLDRLASETVLLPDIGSKTLAYAYWKNGVRKTTTDPESGDDLVRVRRPEPPPDSHDRLRRGQLRLLRRRAAARAHRSPTTASRPTATTRPIGSSRCRTRRAPARSRPTPTPTTRTATG